MFLNIDDCFQWAFIMHSVIVLSVKGTSKAALVFGQNDELWMNACRLVRQLTRFWNRFTETWMPKLLNIQWIRMWANTSVTIVFFIQLNHKIRPLTKWLVYISIFIYLKCIIVQKYRRSAAPWYLYKINTPFKQNKLQEFWHRNRGIVLKNWNKKRIKRKTKKKQSKVFTRIQMCGSVEL